MEWQPTARRVDVMSELKVRNEGTTLHISKGCAFWVWEFEEGDRPEEKNTFVVDTAGTPHISFDDIPKIIEWLQSLEKYRL